MGRSSQTSANFASIVRSPRPASVKSSIPPNPPPSTMVLAGAGRAAEPGPDDAHAPSVPTIRSTSAIDAEDAEVWDEADGVGMVVPGGDCLRQWRRGKCVRSLLPQHVRGSTFSAARVGNQHATSAAILESGFIRDFAKDIDPVQPFARLDIIKDR